MNGIIRVFPRRHKEFTPDDDMVFIGEPPEPHLMPEHKEVHISCTFTWDKPLCEFLAYQWEGQTNRPVKLGGPAYGSPAEEFIPGMYVKAGITYTTRGCNNQCPWCRVPIVEGRLREIPIHQGNIIQDNNFLQASQAHKEKVFDMLRTQKGICFKGGLAANLINSHFIDNITSLRISELWLACDTDDALPKFKEAAAKLVKAGFNREKIKCYTLIGDDRDKNEARLQKIFHAGAMPFAMLYRDFSNTKTDYGEDWNAYARSWQRPASIKAHMKYGTSYKDFNT